MRSSKKNNSVDLDLSSNHGSMEKFTTAHARLGSQLDASIDTFDEPFITQPPVVAKKEEKNSPRAKKSSKSRKKSETGNAPIAEPVLDPEAYTARGKHGPPLNSSIDNLPPNIRNIAQDQKEKGILLSSGNFRFQDRLLGYSLRKLLDYNLYLHLNVPETGQSWSLMVPYLEELEDILRIWERQKKIFHMSNLNKLNTWVLGNVSIEFEDFLIVSTNFGVPDFRKKVMKELAFIVYTATVIIQKIIRGYRIRQAFRRVIRAMRLNKINATKVNKRLYGEVSPLRKLSTKDLLTHGKKGSNSNLRQNSYGILPPENMHRNSSKNLTKNHSNHSNTSSNNNFAHYRDSQRVSSRGSSRRPHHHHEHEPDALVQYEGGSPTKPLSIRKDLANVKAEINSALGTFQQQLEYLQNVINSKKDASRTSKRVKAPEPDPNTVAELENAKIANYIMQVSAMNNTNALKNELATVASKLENLENLYALQSENALEIEKTAKIEVAKARLVAEKASERAAERVRMELINSYEHKIKVQTETEYEKFIRETTELKRLEELQHMAREDEAMRAYNNFLIYEYKLKQMKMEIYIRDAIIEKNKHPSRKPKNMPEELKNFAESSPPPMKQKSAATTTSTKAESRGSPGAQTFPTAASVKASSSEITASPAPAKPDGGSRPSMLSPKLRKFSIMNLFTKTDEKKATITDIVSQTYTRPPLTREMALFRIKKFIMTLIMQKRNGVLKDIKQVRLQRQLQVIDETESVATLAVAMRTAIECASVDLIGRCQETFMRLLTTAERESTPFFVSLKLIVEMLEMFNSRLLISAECTWLYLRFILKMDVSGENMRSIMSSKMVEVLYEKSLEYISDGKIVFSLTKCLYQIYVAADLSKNQSLRSDECLNALKHLFYNSRKIPGIVENIIRIFHKIGQDEPHFQIKICTSEFCEQLSGCMEDNMTNERVITWISKLIVVLCKNNPTAQDYLSSSFYPILYCQAVAQFKTKPKALEQLIYAVLAIIQDNFPCKKRIQDGGILKRLLRLLDLNKNSPSVVICSVWAVSNLVSNGRWRMKEINNDIHNALLILQNQTAHSDLSRHATRVISEVFEENFNPLEVDTPQNSVELK